MVKFHLWTIVYIGFQFTFIKTTILSKVSCEKKSYLQKNDRSNINKLFQQSFNKIQSLDLLRRLYLFSKKGKKIFLLHVYLTSINWNSSSILMLLVLQKTLINWQNWQASHSSKKTDTIITKFFFVLLQIYLTFSVSSFVICAIFWWW